MSTSLLVTKMQKVAKELNFESKIWAVSTDIADENMAKADVVLMGPQIRFMESAMVEKGKKLGIPVAVSYTHLDVYKRQIYMWLWNGCGRTAMFPLKISSWKS